MRRGFSANPDRVAGQREALERRRVEAPRLKFEQGCELARLELGVCVALGLTWREIIPRLRARAGLPTPSLPGKGDAR